MPYSLQVALNSNLVVFVISEFISESHIGCEVWDVKPLQSFFEMG